MPAYRAARPLWVTAQRATLSGRQCTTSTDIGDQELPPNSTAVPSSTRAAQPSGSKGRRVASSSWGAVQAKVTARLLFQVQEEEREDDTVEDGVGGSMPGQRRCHRCAESAP